MAISNKRLKELKRFCLRYDDWQKALKDMDLYPGRSLTIKSVSEIQNGDPTFDFAEIYSYFADRIRIVENCVKLSTNKIAPELLLAVTKDLTYDDLKGTLDSLGCNKEYYDKIYTRFFTILDRARKLHGI